jgi:SAM-dependent methyltransferase
MQPTIEPSWVSDEVALGSTVPLAPALGDNLLVISGWAAAERGIESVTVRIAGRELAAEIGLATPAEADVPDWPGADRAGFELRIDTSGWQRGEHPLEISATAVGGKTRALSGTADVQPHDPPPLGDDGIAEALAGGRPALIGERPDFFGAGTAGPETEVSGWAWSAADIESVLVTVDRRVRIRALHALVRPDLRHLLGGELGAAGFAVRLGPDEWTEGEHELSVIAVARDGQAVGFSAMVRHVPEPPPNAAPDGVLAPLADHASEFVPEVHRDRSVAPEHYARYLWAADLTAGMSVLDVRCGNGWSTALLAERARSAIGIDPSPSAVAEAERRHGEAADFRTGELPRLPLPDAELDAVVCFDALERTADPEQALDELARVLRPGGLLIVATVNRGAYPPGNPLHVSELTAAELEAALRGRFSNVAVHRQQSRLASLLCADGEIQAGDPLQRLELGVVKVAASAPDDAPFSVAVASDGPLPPPPARLAIGGAVDLDEQRRIAEHWRQRSVDAEIMLAVIRTDAHYASHAHREAAARAAASELALKRRAAALESDLEAARAATAALRDSASWRLTAPLRALKRRLGRGEAGA